MNEAEKSFPNYMENNAMQCKQAAEQGDAEAQYALGMYYYGGVGVVQDFNQAAYWYKKVAEQGNANAQYFLGRCYENGIGVVQDYHQAVEWYRKAAAQGNFVAEEAKAALQRIRQRK
jgi:TPR repeat protein